MQTRKKIVFKHFAGGINLSKGELNLKPEENVESRNMKYEIDGAVSTGKGYGDPGWAWNESGKGIDGLFVMSNYPNLFWTAVNGKIKYVDATTSPQTAGVVYEADTTLSLTAANPVFFKEYRGTLYFCNGTNDLGRISVGQLASSVAAGAGTWTLNAAEGYKFTNGADTAYCAGDEANYTAVSTESLTTVTNGLAHSAGAYVTQYNSVSSTYKPKTMAFFKETMWVAGHTSEPNVLRYGKTVSTVASLVAGNIHDFSDGNNYMIGEGGVITALYATRDRLYVCTADRIYYVTTQINSSGVEVFSKDYLFSSIHGCPNAYSITEMGDVIVVFTGKRVLRIGYNPQNLQLLPDEDFDNEIAPVLRTSDTDQSGAEVYYNEDDKELRLKFKKDGIFRVAIYNNITKEWSYPSEEDSARYIKHARTTYFGDPNACVTYKLGNSLDADTTSIIHRYVTGRNDGGSRNKKLFLRGRIEGSKRPGNTLYVTTYIDNQIFGGARVINDANMLTSIPGNPTGDSVLGEDTLGGEGDNPAKRNYVYPFLIGRRGTDIRLVLSSNEIGSDWAAAKGEVEYEENFSDASKYY